MTRHHTEPHGHCHPDFAHVRATFERGFADHGELGASVCVHVDGERVVDLWGGMTAVGGNSVPWEADTLVPVFSCTKGWTAMCVHVLAARGLVDFNAPVAQYWPEFGQAGKSAVTVRMLLDHSAGLPGWRDPLPDGSVYDWDYMTDRCAAEAPFWEPGTRHGYHAFSFGWLVGEIVRRVSGRTLGAFLREEIADPLGADVWLGLPESEERRVAAARFHVPDPNRLDAMTRAALTDPSSIQAIVLTNTGGMNVNTRECYKAEIGAAGGLASARGLADVYRPLAQGGEGLVDADTLALMGEVSTASGSDATLLLATRFSLGFMKSTDNRANTTADPYSAITSATAFGHPGMGGSIGFADPGCNLSFGYVMNRQGSSALLNERGQGLVDATYRALGYRTDRPGFWIR